jgi:hypothetical protein
LGEKEYIEDRGVIYAGGKSPVTDTFLPEQ